ncbi:hypothetical protein V2G26_001284 [Clonostachys chloroleuca]
MPRTRWRASPGEPGGACKQYLHLLGLDTEPHQRPDAASQVGRGALPTAVSCHTGRLNPSVQSLADISTRACSIGM